MPAFIAQEKPAMYLALRCQLACPNEFQLRALGIPLRCRDLLSLVLLCHWALVERQELDFLLAPRAGTTILAAFKL